MSKLYHRSKIWVLCIVLCKFYGRSKIWVLYIVLCKLYCRSKIWGRIKKFESRLKFKPQLKYGWFNLKLYSMFQDLSRRSIETGFRGFETLLKLIKFGFWVLYFVLSNLYCRSKIGFIKLYWVSYIIGVRSGFSLLYCVRCVVEVSSGFSILYCVRYIVGVRSGFSILYCVSYIAGVRSGFSILYF